MNGERAISADTALRLARYFGTTPEFWIKCAGNDLNKARKSQLRSGHALPGMKGKRE